ncbi:MULTISPECIES: hypothetical protein [Clostridium]|uniref:hypothetical protein n=1 Tax=Clostridium TaxID=1485 RepID=UPI001966FA9B|nr:MULTISPECIES: hypothetical protein [Clostridium]MBN1062686.1 hypothetical protein [Clostridium botulinum]
MTKYILDTGSVNCIYDSLAKILNTNNDKLKQFIENNFNGYELDLDSFYNEFRIKKDNFYFECISIHHITTRLTTENTSESFSIDNLEKVLLSDNSLTKFFKENQIRFLNDDGIVVYYNDEIANFTGYTTARLKKRLNYLNDSCINGFLFSDEMPCIYSGLTGMPEIVSDILTALNRTDLQKKYFENMKCFVSTIKVNIDDFIIDNLNEVTSKVEKSKIILKYVLSYLCLKYANNIYYSFENPIIRLPDNINIDNSSILYLKEISNYRQIFHN